MNIGSALLGGEDHMQIRGRNMETGIPESIIVGRGEISYAIKNEVRDMVNAIKETLAQTPPELAGDIYDTGITLTGGGANLDGIAELVGRETGMAVRVAEDPENCVVKGALMALDMGEEAGIYHEAVSA